MATARMHQIGIVNLHLKLPQDCVVLRSSFKDFTYIYLQIDQEFDHLPIAQAHGY
jgi:uncharacterized protein YcgL (UPF0745 family)